MADGCWVVGERRLVVGRAVHASFCCCHASDCYCFLVSFILSSAAGQELGTLQSRTSDRVFLSPSPSIQYNPWKVNYKHACYWCVTLCHTTNYIIFSIKNIFYSRLLWLGRTIILDGLKEMIQIICDGIKIYYLPPSIWYRCTCCIWAFLWWWKLR